MVDMVMIMMIMVMDMVVIMMIIIMDMVMVNMMITMLHKVGYQAIFTYSL